MMNCAALVALGLPSQLKLTAPGAPDGCGPFTSDGSTGALYAGGGVSDGIAGHWIVRQSDDAGSNWRTVDDFQHAPGKASACTDLAADDRGVVYAVGRGTQVNGATGSWVVRKVEAGSNDFLFSDQYRMGSGQLTAANGIRGDAAGNLFVTGYGRNAAATHWITRKLGAACE